MSLTNLVSNFTGCYIRAYLKELESEELKRLDSTLITRARISLKSKEGYDYTARYHKVRAQPNDREPITMTLTSGDSISRRDFNHMRCNFQMDTHSILVSENLDSIPYEASLRSEKLSDQLYAYELARFIYMHKLPESFGTAKIDEVEIASLPVRIFRKSGIPKSKLEKYSFLSPYEKINLAVKSFK